MTESWPKETAGVSVWIQPKKLSYLLGQSGGKTFTHAYKSFLLYNITLSIYIKNIYKHEILIEKPKYNNIYTIV